MKKDMKTVALVALGVMVAGAIMNQFYNQIGVIEFASDGFDK